MEKCINRFKPIRKYRGIEWRTDIELSHKLGKGKTYVTYHIKCGETYEQIIDKVLNSPNSYRGIEWTNDTELSIKLKQRSNYVLYYRKKGKSYKEIIDCVLDHMEEDILHEYRGIQWKTDAELSSKLNKHLSYVHTYRKRSKTYEEIIDNVLDSSHNKNVGGEYRGITWQSMRELSMKLNKPQHYVSYCIRRGETYEEIIDRTIDQVLNGSSNNYRGIRWTSDRDLSRQLNMNDAYVYYHKKLGRSYEEIIDMALNQHHSYRGITWISNRDLCRKLNYSHNYLVYYLNNGWTYEQIIDKVLDKKYKN